MEEIAEKIPLEFEFSAENDPKKAEASQGNLELGNVGNNGEKQEISTQDLKEKLKSCSSVKDVIQTAKPVFSTIFWPQDEQIDEIPQNYRQFSIQPNSNPTNVEILEDDEENETREKFTRDLFQLKSPNLNSSVAVTEDFVEIRFSASRGRHLVVTKDVPLGTTVLVEKPFVGILNGTLDLNLTHCHYCFKKVYPKNCVTCSNCIFALFCSEDCRASAQNSFHHYECPALPSVRQVLSKLSKYDSNALYIAFKTICQMGPTPLFDLYREKNVCPLGHPVDLNPGEMPGIDPKTGRFESNSYHSILSLASNFDPSQLDPNISLVALKLTQILEKVTLFFNKCDDPEFQDYVAELILHHYLCYYVNTYYFRGVEVNPGKGQGQMPGQSNCIEVKGQCNDLPYIFYGECAYAVASLINHSCIANVNRYCDTIKGHGVTAWVTLQALKAGDELCVSYGPSFWTSEELPTTELRQQRLLKDYGFLCTCAACQLSATEEEVKVHLFCQANCAFCNDKTKEGRNICENLSKIAEEYVIHQNVVEEAWTLLKERRPMKAIDKLNSAIEFYQNHVILPSRHLSSIQIVLGKAIELAIALQTAKESKM